VTVAVTVTVTGFAPDAIGMIVTRPTGLSVEVEIVTPTSVVVDGTAANDVEMGAGAIDDGVM
jgi:hypothetical protein